MKRPKVTLPKSDNNAWARGCPKCKYGIASAPELTGACELHLERLVQAIAKQLVFCDCQAGKLYRVYLLNRRQKLIEEARRDPRMHEYAQRLTHPDIEVSEWQVATSYAMLTPTMHFEGSAAPVPAAQEPAL